jgi:hypothetical protein
MDIIHQFRRWHTARRIRPAAPGNILADAPAGLAMIQLTGGMAGMPLPASPRRHVNPAGNNLRER